MLNPRDPLPLSTASIKVRRCDSEDIARSGSGRAAPIDWKAPAAEIADSENIRIAMSDPDTPGLAVRKRVASINKAQVAVPASVIAVLLGGNGIAAHSRSAPPVRDMLAL